MKTIILILGSMMALSASAHMITGQPVLKGSIKTKIVVDGIKTTCKVKIEKPKNLLVEDSYGNPAYKVLTEVNLSGSEFMSDKRIEFTKKFHFTNFFVVGSKTEVRDLEYATADGATMRIDGSGFLKQYSFDYNFKRITCSF